ncbi:MAG: hypothetical protein OHK0015_46930 [Chloroflexi bacterium OHK40]
MQRRRHERVSLVLPQLIRAIEAVFKQLSWMSNPQQFIGYALQPFLGRPDLLLPEQMQPNPARYQTYTLYVDPLERFSVVSAVWLPGQHTPIHDHIAWCVVGVHRGWEQEEQFVWSGALLRPSLTLLNPPGSVGVLSPPRDIHRVRNPGPGLAISIHIYGANIADRGSSIQRCYPEDLVGNGPTPVGPPHR